MLRHLEACGFPAERPVSEAPLTVADGHPVAVTTFVDGAPPAPTHATWIAVAELAGRLASLPVPPAAVEGAPDLADLPRGLVHPDLLLPNVLDAPGELVVIDWAGAGVGPRALALGGLLRFGALEPDGWSVRRFQAMLDAFERHAQLAPDERARVPQLVQHKPS